MTLQNSIHLIEHYNRLYGFDLLDAYDHCVLVLTKFALLDQARGQDLGQVQVALADCYIALVMMADSYARVEALSTEGRDDLPPLAQAFTNLALDLSFDRDLSPALSDLVSHLWQIAADWGYDLEQCLNRRVTAWLNTEEMDYAAMG
ncbi:MULTISPECIES: hypothetical protein [Aerococcus]|uniref:hypothetical protein n=1 Tax=Aerococcus TaxID=1375 RepID=UPI000DCE0FDE|nr:MULTISPECIES: hypothetical protein [Aerococcus]KAA9219180.1 hypothetical protein F6I39_04940 [Aerococcus loyolae]KAA9264207.1 hypothetical protein F6I19_07935 [Aerococcus loyolae]MCY3084077.1 hypothetical protein [Aerococcus mictus]MDK6231520.1 hypothetical protein [Aerococcus urinae]MDK6257518.1 hypothetical protein [Aerococcus urinae]